MAWDGSGNFLRTNGVHSGATTWQQDSDAGTPITASRFDTHDEDIATGLENCVTRDGQNAASANLPMGGFKHTNVAEAAARTQYARASQIQDGGLIYAGTAGGTAGALTVALVPTITAYVTGMRVLLKVANNNTAAPTINIDSIGAKNIRKASIPSASVAPIEANDLVTGQIADLVYDGTQFILMNPAGPSEWVTYTPNISASGSMTWTSETIHYAKYKRMGKLIVVHIKITGTTGGSASTDLRVTLPIAATDLHAVGSGCTIFENGAQKAGAFSTPSAADTLSVTRYDGGNWTLAADTGFNLTCIYEP